MTYKRTNRVLDIESANGSYILERMVHLDEKCRQWNEKEGTPSSHYSTTMTLNSDGYFKLCLDQHLDITEDRD